MVRAAAGDVPPPLEFAASAPAPLWIRERLTVMTSLVLIASASATWMPEIEDTKSRWTIGESGTAITGGTLPAAVVVTSIVRESDPVRPSLTATIMLSVSGLTFV